MKWKAALCGALLLLASSPAAALDVGQKAPDFTAMSHVGEVRLSDYLGKGNVILAFYFAIFTPA